MPFGSVSAEFPLDKSSNCKPSLVSSTCPYCGVGCGVEISLDNQQTIESLKGSAEHPANFGRLCVKGSKLIETNTAKGRLLSPTIEGKKASWEDAIQRVADTFQQLIAEHGPNSVAFYVSGQLLTEDYYVANKLMKGYIGSANIDTNSRLCMSSAVAAYKRAFGADAVPCCYEDIEQTELLILVGSNAAWTHPVLFQRMERAKKLNPAMKVVTIDPRKTATSELADIHLAIKPGTDVALFNGLIHYLSNHQGLDDKYINSHTDGFEQVLDNCIEWTVENVSQVCDIPELDVTQFYQLFHENKKVVTAYCMGVNQSTSGTDKANAIINCHLATGKIGREGCGPFSLTGQPNAMGGREVGGLANMLACHMDIDNEHHRSIVQGYWQSPSIANKAGLKAVDLFDAIDKGAVKAIWIMATNPLVSMPNHQKVVEALKKCEMVVVSDCVAKNQTLEFAHIALPATGWSEKDGTVTNSERCISRQRGVLSASGEAKHDWQIICEVAKAMGFAEGFNFEHPSEIFAEYAGLTATSNGGSRDLDLSGLLNLSRVDYDRLKPVQWPVNNQSPEGTKRLFSDGKFYTSNGKAKFIASTYSPPLQLTTQDYPFVLNSGRVRDQWHTMTRTGKAAELTAHTSRPFLAIHPDDALALGLDNDDLVKLDAGHIDSKKSQVCLPIVLDSNQRKNELFAPIHWSAANASSANVTVLYSDANDDISGQPELKHAAVSIDKLAYRYYGQIYCEQMFSIELLREKLEYFVVSQIGKGTLIYFATDQDPYILKSWLQLNFPLYEEWTSLSGDTLQSTCAFKRDKLSLVMFMSTSPKPTDSQWIDSVLGSTDLSPEQLSALLRIEPDEEFKQGKLVCSCFKVRERTIVKAIQEGNTSVEQLGKSVKCGTNCGSCKSELSQLITQHDIEHSKGSLSNQKNVSEKIPVELVF